PSVCVTSRAVSASARSCGPSRSMSWSGWYLRNSSISAILRSVIGVVTPFRLLVVLLLEGNAPVTFSVNHRPDSTGFYTLPGTLTQEFRRILTERRADALRAWLDQAARSSLAPLRGFARSLEQDMDAVMNALTYPWSNGRVEGCINKLKLLKRQMYGRAGIELLRRRFLAMGR